MSSDYKAELKSGSSPLKNQKGTSHYLLHVTEVGHYRVWVSDDDAKVFVTPVATPGNPVLVGGNSLDGILVPADYDIGVKTEKEFTINFRKVD